MGNAHIFQIQIALRNVKPKIWRRVLIQSDMSMSDLHKVIQTSMGWCNCHLHQFIKDGEFYATPLEDDDFFDIVHKTDYKNLKVSDLLKNEKDKMIYEYDFGDGWEHNVVLEKIVPAEAGLKYPVCIAGKNCCPPEDCGGPWGYADMLEVMADPGNERHNDLMEWLGGDFDPKYFDKEEINEMLSEKDYGCPDNF